MLESLGSDLRFGARTLWKSRAFSDAEFLDYSTQNHVFDSAIAMANEDVLYTSGEGTERFQGELITPNTFEFLGVQPLLGRAAQPADYQRGAPPTFVLRYKTWVSRFSSDRSILNKNFTLNGEARTLVGIMPPRFAWGDADMWIPQTPVRGETSNGFPRFWFMLGRLKPGVTKEQGAADFAVLAKQQATLHSTDYPTHFSVQHD